jgi:hypothetical protein
MRSWVLALGVALWACAEGGAQGTNTPPAKAATLHVLERPAKDATLTVPLEAAPRKPSARVVYGGALVRAAKADQPLQMLSPLAPAKYGDGAAHLARDPWTGKAQGFTLFTISFRKRAAKPPLSAP